MSIFVFAPGENWVCDRFVSEWYEHNEEISTLDIEKADTLWLIAGWCWNQIPLSYLQNKKVILTVHHIVPEKFNDEKLREFKFRDQFIDIYHVPCEKTKEFLLHLTYKPIAVIPFWVNQGLWFDISEKESLREKYDIDKDAFIVGSFQRDTEGHDLKSPKLEKGPDLFCDYVEKLAEEKVSVHVLLAGWRRQYVIKRLDEKNIPFYYFELPSFTVVNELYNCLDLYVVSSRYEGGPQSIVECAASKTPIVSTDVGIARDILSDKSIFNSSWEASPAPGYAFNSVKKYFLPNSFDKFKNLLSEKV